MYLRVFQRTYLHQVSNLTLQIVAIYYLKDLAQHRQLQDMVQLLNQVHKKVEYIEAQMIYKLFQHQ